MSNHCKLEPVYSLTKCYAFQVRDPGGFAIKCDPLIKKKFMGNYVATKHKKNGVIERL